MHKYCYYAGSKDFGSTVINSLVHTFSLKIHWKFKNFVLFWWCFSHDYGIIRTGLTPFFHRSCLLIVLLEGDLITGRVWRNSPDGGLPLPFCFFMGTWLQVGSEGILLRMAFPFCFVFARGTWLWNYFALHWNMFPIGYKILFLICMI